MSFLNKGAVFLTSLISVFLGILVGALVMVMAGYNPVDAYVALFTHSLFQLYDLGETIRVICPLILTGLSVALAFRSGLFNIGVEGQFIAGQLAACLISLKVHLPSFLHIFLALFFGMLSGAFLGFIPGFLKATRQVHEVIVSIMLNFVSLSFSNLIIRLFLVNGSDSTNEIPNSVSLSSPLLSNIFNGSRIHSGIFISLIFVLLVYILLYKTKLGFEIRATGLNSFAAEYAGMNIKRNIIFSMVLSGSLAGLAGAIELLGTYKYLSIQPTFMGIGFDGIAVSLLGANTPLGVLLSSVLFGVLMHGGGNMQFEASVPFDVIRIVFAAIILFVAANVSSKILKIFKLK